MNSPSYNLSGSWLDGARAITISYTGKDTVRAEFVEKYECDPQDGSTIQTTNLDFEAKITGDQLEGQTSACKYQIGFVRSGKFGITMTDLKLTISADGKELVGLPPDGGWFNPLTNQWEALTISRLDIPTLIIDSPDPYTTFAITDAPTMPQIVARARITGITPDPTPTTQFEWTVQIRFNAAQTCPPYGPARTFNAQDFTQTVTGGQFTPTFPAVRGGELTFLVRATVNGQTLTASTQGLVIQGTNPDRTLINATLPNKTLRRMACLESGMRQFGMRQSDADVDGGVSNCPQWSQDGKGGVGIMQITSPEPTPNQVWDWIANVQKGIQMLNDTTEEARQFPSRVRNSPFWRPVCNAYNMHRQQRGLPPLQRIDLPEFTSGDFDDNLQQLELDAIRGYNGWAGTDNWGYQDGKHQYNKLHEFRVAFDADGVLQVTVAPDGTTGTAQWERVPVADRPLLPPHNTPNDYVDRVLSQSPTCGA